MRDGWSEFMDNKKGRESRGDKEKNKEGEGRGSRLKILILNWSLSDFLRLDLINQEKVQKCTNSNHSIAEI